MSLTTQLLADAVKKGGPGSGPQGGISSGKAKMMLANASRSANQASRNALGNSTKSNHEIAADKHSRAASLAQRSGNTKLADQHLEQSTYHLQVAHEF